MPVESTINCALDHGDTANSNIRNGLSGNWESRQESAADDEGWDFSLSYSSLHYRSNPTAWISFVIVLPRIPEKDY